MAMLKQMNEAKFLLGVLNKNPDIPSQTEKKDPLVTLKWNSEITDEEEYVGEGFNSS